jgi:ribonuclease HI
LKPDSGVSARAWIDGASRGNPGEAGFGVLVEAGGEREEILGYLGRATNNVAEYAALIAVLTLAADRAVSKLVVYSDSQLLVRQVDGTYRVKAPHLVPMFLRVLRLRNRIPDFAIEHVAREDNKDADRLANQAIDLRAPLPPWLAFEVPNQ